MGSVGNMNGGWAILFKIALSCFPVTLASIGWLCREVVANTRSIAVVSATKFDSDDGLEIWKSIGEVKQDIASIPREVPPKWLVDRLKRLEKTCDRLDIKIDNTNSRINKPETRGEE